MDFTVPTDFKLKIKDSKKINKYLNLARELKKVVEHESNGESNCCWRSLNSPPTRKRGKKTGGIGNQ